MGKSEHLIKSLVRRTWGDRRFRLAKWGLIVLVALALFGDFIANDAPLYCRVHGGETEFPAFREFFAGFGIGHWTLTDAARDWRDLQYDRVVFPPVPYAATETDLSNANFRRPFGAQTQAGGWSRHWLGTDLLGRDVLAGLIFGSRIAILVGLFSMLLAAVIGIPVGAFAGFMGDHRYRQKLPQLILMILGLLGTLYCIILAWMSEGHARTTASLMALVVVIISIVVWYVLNRYWKSAPMVHLPVDSLVLRSIEIVRSIPVFFLLFAILGMVRTPRLIYVIVLIGILWCPSIIRFVRAEALKLRDQTFIQSAQVLGLSPWHIVWRHLIPNAIGPAFITIAFGMGSAVLIESGLSFLGIGIAPEMVTWGKMLNGARSNISAWWMALLPGIAIFITIAIFNRLGDVVDNQLSGR